MNKLDLLMIQNWVVIALLVIFVFLLYSMGQKAQKLAKNPYAVTDGTDIAELWFKDELNELLEVTERILEEFPNRTDALYFRAKAKAKLGSTEESDALLKRLILIEPGLKEQMEIEMIGTIALPDKPRLSSTTNLSSLRRGEEDKPRPEDEPPTA